jgi:hypothetical protein
MFETGSTSLQLRKKIHFPYRLDSGPGVTLRKGVRCVVIEPKPYLCDLRMNRVNKGLLEYVWTEEIGKTTNRLQRKMGKEQMKHVMLR